MNSNAITIEATISAPAEKVWKLWSEPEHIKGWAFASPDWHAPKADNDLREGGSFTTRMEAKDGSFGFEFGGIYTEVVLHKRIAYTLGDDRKVETDFTENGGKTYVKQVFEPEGSNPVDMQKAGWQAILDNFKRYVEAN